MRRLLAVNARGCGSPLHIVTQVCQIRLGGPIAHGVGTHRIGHCQRRGVAQSLQQRHRRGFGLCVHSRDGALTGTSGKRHGPGCEGAFPGLRQYRRSKRMAQLFEFFTDRESQVPLVRPGRGNTGRRSSSVASA